MCGVNGLGGGVGRTNYPNPIAPTLLDRASAVSLCPIWGLEAIHGQLFWGVVGGPLARWTWLAHTITESWASVFAVGRLPGQPSGPRYSVPAN